MNSNLVKYMYRPHQVEFAKVIQPSSKDIQSVSFTKNISSQKKKDIKIPGFMVFDGICFKTQDELHQYLNIKPKQKV